MIGIMDWGIGGFSVYKALRDRGSEADVLYFSDSGTTPYGKLSRDKLRERFVEIAAFFRERGVNEVLVACHSASSALEPEAQSGAEAMGGVAFRSIIPAAARVVARCAANRVGVIGGVVTIQSGVYEKALAGLGKELRFSPAQPLSAFVEAGELDSPAVEMEVRGILERLGAIDSLLLACTHYPALASVFRRLAPRMELLDPGADLAEAVRETGAGRLEFFTTGDREGSVRSARLAFGVEIG
jgi:glutamate racemase